MNTDEGDAERRHREELAGFFDAFAADAGTWYRRNRSYHRQIEGLYRFAVPEAASVLEVGSGDGSLLAALRPSRGVGIDVSENLVALARAKHPQLEFHVASGERFASDEAFDYVVLSDLVPYTYDLVRLFRNVRSCCHDRTRVIVHSYSELWRPVIRIAEILRLKRRKPISNWVTIEDVSNALELAGFEVVASTRRILLPKKIPFLTTFFNGVVANVWPFSYFCLTWWVTARRRPAAPGPLSVSVVVPARNEKGNVAAILDRIPSLGLATEIVFVEGGSTDGTREEIERQVALRREIDIALHVQTGKGKGDAVRLGFDHAKHELLMILDADLSVDPEDLQTFYAAIAEGHADFVNGSRLVYSMEGGAMQFLNLLGNKFFSLVFTWIMRQSVKDTLCGTKVIRAEDYRAIADAHEEFGLLDPFGDFDLLLGAARLGLRIIEVPVRYRARTYGRTNISRFQHGWLLLRMAVRGFVAFNVRPVRV